MIKLQNMRRTVTRFFRFNAFFDPIQIVPASDSWQRALVRSSGAANVAVGAAPDGLQRAPVDPNAFIFLNTFVPFIVPPYQALYAAALPGFGPINLVNLTLILADAIPADPYQTPDKDYGAP